jgi:hypothetical protein
MEQDECLFYLVDFSFGFSFFWQLWIFYFYCQLMLGFVGLLCWFLELLSLFSHLLSHQDLEDYLTGHVYWFSA